MNQARVVKKILAMTLMGWALLFACQSVASEGPKTLIVSAAASLTNVMQALGQDFEQKHPETKITFNFGATGDLLAQMSQGAPVDIFASASGKHMDQAVAKGLIAVQSRKDFAVNSLVLAGPAAGTIPLSGLGDLTRPEVERIGIGKPETVPAGQYAKAALEAVGVWTAVENKLIYGSSVRQVLDYLRRGEVDAGLIYATDAKVAGTAVRVVAEVTGSRVRYPIAMLKSTTELERAAMFLSYLATDAAHAIFKEHGFMVP